MQTGNKRGRLAAVCRFVSLFVLIVDHTRTHRAACVVSTANEKDYVAHQRTTHIGRRTCRILLADYRRVQPHLYSCRLFSVSKQLPTDVAVCRPHKLTTSQHRLTHRKASSLRRRELFTVTRQMASLNC